MEKNIKQFEMANILWICRTSYINLERGTHWTKKEILDHLWEILEIKDFYFLWNFYESNI
jgi:DNA-binding XRE family transcriptional regulator